MNLADFEFFLHNDAPALAAIGAAVTGGAVALRVGRATRQAKAGELLLPATDEVLMHAQQHLDATVNAYRRLVLIEPDTVSGQYWDHVLVVLQSTRDSLQRSDFRSIRDHLAIMCGSESHVFKAFDALQPLHRRYERKRVQRQAATTATQRRLIVRQYLELLYRAEKFAALAREHRRLLALGRTSGPQDAGVLSQAVRCLTGRTRPVWSDYAPDDEKVREQLKRFDKDPGNPFGLRDETVLLTPSSYPGFA